MLNIYSAREDFDKEKFIYENIEGDTLVIVPDQYTLIGEEQAMKYMGSACLLDVEIISMSRLGLRALTERGLENTEVLGKYERNMLLSKIIREHREELEVFKLAASKRSFVEMVNNFISDFKLNDCTISDLTELTEDEAADPLLRRKLSEIRLLVEAYESEVDGRFTDSEDYIDKYTRAIAECEQFRDKSIWLYGFDSMTPKFISAVIELARVSRNVSVMLNESDFGLEQSLRNKLIASAYEGSIPCQNTNLSAHRSPEYRYEKSETIRTIERQLFARAGANGGASGSFDPEGLRVIECANPYYEAENAAAYVYELLRVHGYRMNDIVIICNDSGQMQKVVKRVFDEYGLPMFLDSMRGIGDSQVIGFIVSLLEAAHHDYRTNAILSMVKSGLAGVNPGDAEELENYVKNYNIRGTMWKKEFRYGSFEYTEAAFEMLNGVRAMLQQKVGRLKEIAKDAKTMDDFARAFYLYLNEEWELKAKVDHIKEEQYQLGMFEESQRTVQCYNEAIRILDRVRDIMGDSAMDFAEFIALYTEGVMSAEVGLIPPTLDGLSMGTMIRTRPAPPKAVLVLGANEGVLPMEPGTEGLFSIDEKAFFLNHSFPLGSLDDIKMNEENVAMYRLMARASERVYVSYSMSDGMGGDRKPSVLVDSIKALFPALKVERDVVSRGFGMQLVTSGGPTLRHMVNYFKEKPWDAAILEAAASEGSKGTEAAAADASVKLVSDAVMRWYEANEPEVLERVVQAGTDENKVNELTDRMAKRLFARSDGDFSFSASRLEKYNHCPFEHFIMHGLRPKEQREFKGGAREIGDLFHECIMNVSKRLIRDGILDKKDGAVRREYSHQDVADMVSAELDKLSGEYRDGLFASSGSEKYRLERIRETCIEAVLVLVMQLNLGQIETCYFEENFGRGCTFEPIMYTLRGEKVFIEGKIDRVDIMKGGKVRIIDYKTGSDELDLDKMRSGYKMQLAVYMQGAESEEREPAGMFYFKINDSLTNAKDADGEKLESLTEKEKDSRFKLIGAYIDDPEIIANMPVDIINSSKSKSLGKDSFDLLEEDVRKAIETISDGIVRGDISIYPTNSRKGSEECTYCQYRSICRFDLSNKHNNYNMID